MSWPDFVPVGRVNNSLYRVRNVFIVNESDELQMTKQLSILPLQSQVNLEVGDDNVPNYQLPIPSVPVTILSL